MKFLDERIEFDFSNLGNTYDDSTYRYDVLIDGELVFVGNVFVESTSTGPIIDVTDIVRNYFEVLKPSFPSTPTKTGIIKEVAVTLYNKDRSDEDSLTEKVYFIYRQQNYNSFVTTELYDTVIPIPTPITFLQGYSQDNINFLPTYPKVPSSVLTFDYVFGNGTLQSKPSVSTSYNNGDNLFKIYETDSYLPANSVYKFSIPLSEILEPQTLEGETVLINTSRYVLSIETSGFTYVSQGDEESNARVYSGTLESTIDTITAEIQFNDIYGSEIKEIPVEKSGETIGFDEYTLSYTTRKPARIIYHLKKNNASLGYLKINFTNTSKITPFMVGITFQQRTFDNLFYLAFAIGTQKEVVFTPCQAQQIVINHNWVSGGNGYPIAKLDGNSRYFLKWRDRYGMPQIQPFKGTYNYKENISRSTVTNYKNTKKLTDVTLQGSWLLNTDYIPEKLYPFYESTFVSPWLQLYDAKEDRLYDVILVNTEYDEKTFNNQSRNLFNLQLEVELDTTQKIIY